MPTGNDAAHLRRVAVPASFDSNHSNLLDYFGLTKRGAHAKGAPRGVCLPNAGRLSLLPCPVPDTDAIACALSRQLNFGAVTRVVLLQFCERAVLSCAALDPLARAITPRQRYRKIDRH